MKKYLFIIFLFTIAATWAKDKKIMSKLISVKTEHSEIKIVDQSKNEIFYQELVSTKLKDKKTEWTYKPSTTPEPAASSEVGEPTPECLVFQSLKLEGKKLKGIYRQGFIRANQYGITDRYGKFEHFQDHEVEIDLSSGKELSNRVLK